ncbi:MAG: hypothetical protein H6815_03710 [Phycisphaeraceae bacterium]|nr:hypothetical protein [Phycisphaerales bacterium]MCB9859535.1 hypothetical protein [Phycisphaeraceae bacterium]
MTTPSTSAAQSRPVPEGFGVGARVRVTQQIPFGTGVRITSVEGEIVELGQQKTGSWFAHSKDGKLWLERIVLRKPDGEIVYCNLDHYSSIEMV